MKGGVAEETGELIRQEHLFRLKDIQTQNQLDKVVAGEQPEEQQDSDSDNGKGMVGIGFTLLYGIMVMFWMLL